jgi:hypothetical protein
MKKWRENMKKIVSLIVFIMTLVLLPISVRAEDAGKKEALKEMVALMLNSKGYLCATVTEIRPLQIKNQYEVTCIAYRNGNAAKTYIFNAYNGTAFEQ